MRLSDKVKSDGEQPLREQGGLPDAVHVFEQRVIDAVDAALAARRPLLVRGEPGTGKSQLARAAAVAMGRAFVSTAVDAQTETRDLLWTLDAVARLAEAQATGRGGRQRVAVRRFVEPGVLWWAFDWTGARGQARRAGSGACHRVEPTGWTPAAGTVVLVDEIDKADSSVPNGLLDALGQGSFSTPWGEAVRMAEPRPLVVITTNEERTLPPAFLRRCFVLQLDLPVEGDGLRDKLVRYGRAHFPHAEPAALTKALDLLAPWRKAVYERGLNPPGVAEYLDLLRAAHDGAKPGDTALDRLDRYADFVVEKHPREKRE